MTDERLTTREALSGRKGVALIMVLTVVTILTVISVEFQYESRVYLQTVANFRDRQRAYYLAKSGVEFTRLILYLQSTVDRLIRQYWKNNPPNIQLWQMIPIDSDLARAVAGGMFSAQDQESLFEGTVAGQGLKEDEEESVAEKNMQQMQTVSFAQGEGFGEFEGHFHAEVIDEESKINVNIRPNNYKEVNTMKATLESLFTPEMYNPVFENPDKDGQYHDRQEIISAIIDWIDPDNTRTGFESGDESSRYDFLDDTYPSKNHLFDSLDELQLVAGIDDRFWRLFGDQFTVYRTGRININTAQIEVLRALLEQYLLKPLPAEQEMQRILDAILDFRLQNSGFWNEDAFVSFLTEGPELILELENGPQGKTALRSAITVQSGVFTVKASGDINGVMREIRVVMTKDGHLLYYREN
ncbi:MAG: hypothetical protein C4523_15655 [Myxococcales bacterium]|nr:MAG: hypothetical protein C4523_15655 [Myxococcales bacterium]